MRRPSLDRYSALIFDVDGTLAETEEVHRQAFNDAFSQFGLPWTWDQSLYKQLLKVTGGKERLRHFVASLTSGADKVDEKTIREIHAFKNARYAELIRGSGGGLRPGVARIIRDAQAKGQRLAIATTTSHSNVEALLTSAWGGVDLFEVIVAGDDVVSKKPAPDVYIKTLELLDLSESRCLAFEDSYNGLLSATAAGLSVIITPSLYTVDEDFSGALVVIDDLNELIHTPR